MLRASKESVSIKHDENLDMQRKRFKKKYNLLSSLSCD